MNFIYYLNIIIFICDFLFSLTLVTVISDFKSPTKLGKKEWDRIKRLLILKRIKLSDVHFIQIKNALVLHQITR